MGPKGGQGGKLFQPEVTGWIDGRKALSARKDRMNWDGSRI